FFKKKNSLRENIFRAPRASGRPAIDPFSFSRYSLRELPAHVLIVLSSAFNFP
uniref:Ovule protein n=1 Tax=Ascaris lumbricoides TaxID=6252 RepID=A0A0M3HQB9_ASCLU